MKRHCLSQEKLINQILFIRQVVGIFEIDATIEKFEMKNSIDLCNK